MAIAVLQIYGQERAERYRKAADAEIGRISAGVNRIGFECDRIGTGIELQRTAIEQQGVAIAAAIEQQGVEVAAAIDDITTEIERTREAINAQSAVGDDAPRAEDIYTTPKPESIGELYQTFYEQIMRADDTEQEDLESDI